MIKKLIYGLCACCLLIMLYSCSDQHYDSDAYEGDENSTVILANGTTPERKIIYTVNISFDVDKLEDASIQLRSMIEADEWFDSESESSNQYAYTIRVKTTRLDAFINQLKEDYTLRTYEKNGTDISIEYQDTTNRILALEAQMARLLILYENASLSEMIEINAQISEIEVELQSLEGTLNQFDSLVEYSEVYLVFYGSTVVSKSPFFNRLANGFIDGFKALISFFDGFVMVFATVLPFVVVFGGVGLGGYFIYKKQHLKGKKNHNKKGE